MFREGVKKICRYQIFRFNILFNLNDKSYHFLIITLISIKCVDRKKETRENFIQRYTFPPLGGMITYSTCVLYCNVLYCTVLYCTVLYCTVLYCTVLYYTIVLMYCEGMNLCVSTRMPRSWL